MLLTLHSSALLPFRRPFDAFKAASLQLVEDRVRPQADAADAADRCSRFLRGLAWPADAPKWTNNAEVRGVCVCVCVCGRVLSL